MFALKRSLLHPSLIFIFIVKYEALFNQSMQTILPFISIVQLIIAYHSLHVTLFLTVVSDLS